ncbi:MAG: alanine/ornithine racemase family PLP-dependent enzyme, partial [Oligoflexia bacterium]|nr:alanine/ornithine racemase family PLP-dependent enzyme [Oligoflexia bacterium]
VFVDRGVRKQALLSFGRVDVDYRNCVPVDDKLILLGQTSDHTLIDLEDSQRSYRRGDQIAFEVDYTALLSLCNSDAIAKVFIDE